MTAPFQKVVLRFRDGTMEKTTTFRHFSIAHGSIQVVGVDGKVRWVKTAELKAVFFVRELDGNPEYREHKDMGPGGPRAGKTVQVTFPDGEILMGKSINPEMEGLGFFLFPADPASNNERVFVVRDAVSDIQVTD